MPGITCKIIGSGPEKKRLDDLILNLQLNDNVKILGNIEHCQDLYGLMKSSKILVLPSVREGFGLVVIEANAAGLPVITTRHKNNAAKDLIVDGVNGLFAEPDPRSIADKIIQALAAKGTMRPKKDIDSYSWQVVTDRIEQIFRSYKKLP